MKALHIYKDYYPPIVGGIERHMAQLCRNLRPLMDVEALVCNRSLKTEVEYVDDVQVTKVGQLGRFQSAPISPTFPYWLKVKRADILHFQLPNPTAVLSYFLARPQGKVVVSYQSDIIRQALALKFYRPFLFAFLKRADKILVSSTNYLEGSQILSSLRGKCEIVSLTIDFSAWQLNDSEHVHVEALRQRVGEPFLLFAGKLRYYKGLEYLVRAMREIRAPLVIVGTGPTERSLEKLTRALGLQDKVHFVGEVSDRDLVYYYHACSAFVLPSTHRSEAFAVVQLEAQACGKPVISTGIGTGVEHVNLHGHTGLIVPPGDSESLARAANVLIGDDELRLRLGRQARERVEKKFKQDEMIRTVYAIYQDICGI